ncbi:MAG: ABC transporter ATP-binding protein [Candidatus Brocadiae bacterium]|nr:ABC transporter ATP-binding protein [Candidatus Brocadiia bacterium]
MPVLQIRDLKKSYTAPDGTESAVVDVPKFDLESGAQAALAGGSGSGKTTLLNLIAGILRADSGSIRIGDASMTEVSEPARDSLRAREIGYVFQTFNLLQGFTARENIELGMMFGRGVDRAHAAHLIGRVGLTDRADYRPRQLSVGQQQRVAIARALANKPRLVLADEPTGNLDPQNARECLALIREVCRESGAALLLVSHDTGILDSFPLRFQLSDINRAAQPAATTGGPR